VTSIDLLPILPLLVLSGSAAATLVLLTFRRGHGLVFGTTLAGLVLTIASIPRAASAPDPQVTPLVRMDGLALLIVLALAGAAAVVACLARDYLEKRPEHPEEFYVLLQLATLGSAVLASSTHFASLFLGLETLSVSLYGLIAYSRSAALCAEAGIKYLVLAGASSGFLLFGMALLYAETGALDFAGLAAGVQGAPPDAALVVAGLALLLVGVGFKLALVPFHIWTPDVYQGAPAPVTAFIATVSKGGMVAAVLRFLGELDLGRDSAVFFVLAAIAGASMLVGNLLALEQSNVKRILAYSSIAHFGYLLVAVLADGTLARTAAVFYLVAYFATTLAAFGVVTVLSGPDRDADRVSDYRGLFWRRPPLAGVLTVSLLSLAGIPLTAGFLGKFYVLSAGVESALFPLVLLLAAGSAIGVYYYLRIVVTMADGEEHGGSASTEPRVPIAAGALLFGLLVLVVWLGVQPGPVLAAVESAVAGLR
jgi:NADH-quinone oxidoreductase subunit N